MIPITKGFIILTFNTKEVIMQMNAVTNHKYNPKYLSESIIMITNFLRIITKGM